MPDLLLPSDLSCCVGPMQTLYSLAQALHRRKKGSVSALAHYTICTTAPHLLHTPGSHSFASCTHGLPLSTFTRASHLSRPSLPAFDLALHPTHTQCSPAFCGFTPALDCLAAGCSLFDHRRRLLPAAPQPHAQRRRWWLTAAIRPLLTVFDQYSTSSEISLDWY